MLASTKAVISQLEGQIEELVEQRFANGGIHLSNHVAPQTPLGYDIGLLPTLGFDGVVHQPMLAAAPVPGDGGQQPGVPTVALPEIGKTGDIFGPVNQPDELDALGPMEAVSGNRTPVKRNAPANRLELMTALEAYGLRAYPRKEAVAQRATPQQFTTEVKPVFGVLALDVREAARGLHLSEEVKVLAARAALNLLTDATGGDQTRCEGCKPQRQAPVKNLRQSTFPDQGCAALQDCARQRQPGRGGRF